MLSVQVKSRLVDLCQAVLVGEDEHELLGNLVFLAIRQHLALTMLMEHDHHGGDHYVAASRREVAQDDTSEVHSFLCLGERLFCGHSAQDDQH